MLSDNLRLLLHVFWRPAAAMGAILDRGSLLFATVAVLAVSLLIQFTVTPKVVRWVVTAFEQPKAVEAPDLREDEPGIRRSGWLPFTFSLYSCYSPLLVLAVIYVPGTLLLSTLIAGLGRFGAVFQRDYSPLLTCSAMAWAASSLPVIVAATLAPAPAVFAVGGLACLYFALLMFFAVRTVFGTSNGAAASVVVLSWIPVVLASPLLAALGSMAGWLASPCLLLYAYYYLGGELAALGAGLRSRLNLRRMLEAAAVNPHDSDAQYQIGIMYQQRRQYTEAIERFKKAIAIDPRETDAHFQLGRIARAQGRLADAIASFQTVLEQDSRHSHYEILREAGELYLTAGQLEDARGLLSSYIEQRPYDPEGLFYYGQTLARLGDARAAGEMYGRAIEAVRTAPRHRLRSIAKWSRLAQKAARKLPISG